ncbi:response regulator transcription factor [Clostridium gasigenes]|uniref:response regulator transcription factor n=1 Tax=Clostridium gasigenes TaxID=94869 RepID=UPI001C0D54AA|nr:response regulator transcription factor [Clostridium gasigenes]MBU3105014.1 response regulator transcription factor [Clostridium gasigenes]
MKLMIIEDDEIIRQELKCFLSKYGYEVDAPEEFENIVEYVLKKQPNIILLDINLPIYDGFYICKEIRKESYIPIIVVTSRNTQVDELISMNSGADDFITKPYNTQILLARIQSIIKRTYGNTTAQEIITYKNLRLNLSDATISLEDKLLDITKNEMKILNYLIKKSGNIVSRESLMTYLWNDNSFVDDNTLTVNIARLRKKLTEIGMKDTIHTKRGLGYIIQ